MRKLLACAALLLSTSAIADSGLKYFYSTDSDQNSTSRYTVTGWTKSGFGVATTRGLHKTNTLHRYSTSVEGAVQYYGDRFTADGTLGIGEVSGKRFFSGDLGMTVRVNDPLHINIAVFGDLVDSTPGLEKGLSYAGVSVGPEYKGRGWGALTNVRALRFKDNNQAGADAKIYKDVADGVNVFVAARVLSNNNPNNGDYWSPDDYRRVIAGVGLRHHTDHWRFTGSIGAGQANVDGDTQVASSFKATATRAWGDWSTRLIAGAEHADGTKYRYHYLSASVILRF